MTRRSALYLTRLPFKRIWSNGPPAQQRQVVSSALAAADGTASPEPPTASSQPAPGLITPRSSSTTSNSPPGREPLSLTVPAYSVWGANTNVGKTLVSVGLAYAAAAAKIPLAYVKPVQTGFPSDSDARLVALACGGVPEMGPHAAEAAARQAAEAAPPPLPSVRRLASPAPRCTTLFAWRHAVSPHLAVRLEGRPVGDEEIVAATSSQVRQSMDELSQLRGQTPPPPPPPPSSSLPLPSSSLPATAADAAAAAGGGGGSGGGGGGGLGGGSSLLLVETAGGVTSPAPSGRLACDVLRPLRLPAILVGDPRLGGISATLSAYDSLVARGWDVEAVVLVGQGAVQLVPSSGGSGGGPEAAGASTSVPLDNLSFLRDHFSGPAAGPHRLGAPPPEVLGVPGCPPPPEGHNPHRDGLDPSLLSWLPASLPAFTRLLEALTARHQQRISRLLAARAAAEAHVWWPFTQHAGLTPGSATLVDGRSGETWTALVAAAAPPPAGAAAAPPPPAPALVPLYDASGSWWTQAATPALQPELARAVSYAAGRYLHVLFAEVAHEPAVAAATALLGPGGPGAGWADRVFFSDDGSTAVEVALKMAFRKFLADRGELEQSADGAEDAAAAGASSSSASSAGSCPSSSSSELFVLGLQGAYHGDTLGSQDCVAPSVFNGRLQAPWYRGRGLFLEPPYVGMKQGRWQLIDPPAWLTRRLGDQSLPTWASLDEMLYGSSGTAPVLGSSSAGTCVAPRAVLTAAYMSYIDEAIAEFEAASGGARRLAASIIEPLLQGAGGMGLVEPGFQRAMAEACRTRRLPLILDEVFTGLYRTGRLSAASALGLTPDIACYGKLLTGGAVPMAVTLATREVFQAFNGPSKLFALLHGHSYTAYPIGCAAAVASMQLLSSPETNPNVCAPCRCPKTPACDQPCGRLLPVWDEQLVSELSYHPLAKRVVAVGTVLAVELEVQPGGPGGGGSVTHGSGPAPATAPPAQDSPSETAAALTTAPSTEAGYGSVSAVHVVRRLRDEYGIYARPLGPVVYLMVPPTAPRATAAWLGGCLRAVLDACAAGSRGSVCGPEDQVVV